MCFVKKKHSKKSFHQLEDLEAFLGMLLQLKFHLKPHDALKCQWCWAVQMYYNTIIIKL